MNESGLWQYLKGGMAGKWLATRIESSAGNGVPDVAFSLPGMHGFIELKYIKEWPKRLTTKVKLPIRPEQKIWISTRGNMSGKVWVLCRIEDSFFLLDWKQVSAAEEGWEVAEWYSNSHYSWLNRIDFDKLQKIIGA